MNSNLNSKIVKKTFCCHFVSKLGDQSKLFSKLTFFYITSSWVYPIIGHNLFFHLITFSTIYNLWYWEMKFSKKKKHYFGIYPKTHCSSNLISIHYFLKIISSNESTSFFVLLGKNQKQSTDCIFIILI